MELLHLPPDSQIGGHVETVNPYRTIVNWILRKIGTSVTWLANFTNGAYEFQQNGTEGRTGRKLEK